MDLTPGLRALADEVRAANVVVPRGAATQWGVGGDAPDGTAVSAPVGVAVYEPADLTVSVGAGTSVRALVETLAEYGQECPLDPDDTSATIGGVLACGLSGRRRLRFGPIRDRVLEVRFVTGDGRLVKAGGPTVKNVTGYDLCRLLVGSFGTLGVLGQVTLRCEPRPEASRWLVGAGDPWAIRTRVFRPSAVLWDGATVACLVEGGAAEVGAESARSGLEPGAEPEVLQGEYRGRISVAPASLRALLGDLADDGGCRWMAEIGVGTIRVAADGSQGLLSAREIAHRHGGWLLREAGTGVDGWGLTTRNSGIARRIKDALDPDHKLNPGRMP